jgi:hypothetical protein
MFITIDTEKGITCSEGLVFEEAMRLLGSATIHIMNDADAFAKEKANDAEEYEEVHGHIYDMYNFMAGNILNKFDGDRSPCTDLTAQAILEAENAILDRETATVAETEETEDTEETTEDPA